MTGFVSKRQAAQGKLNDDTQVYAGRKRGSIALARSLCYQIRGAADDSDDMDGGGYGSVDIAEILSAEVLRLQKALAQPQQEPVAFLCHGNLYKWPSEDDFCGNPENHIPLYTSLAPPYAVIAGALFDFMGWLTSRKERIVLSSADEASPAVDAIRDFAKMRGFSLDDAKVQDWNTAPPQRTWVGLTEEDICGVLANIQEMYNRPPTTDTRVIFARAIEAKLKERNT